MRKILFISEKDFYGKQIESHGIDVFPPFKKVRGLVKLLRIFHFKLNLGFKKIWFNKFPDLNSYNVIILPALEFTVSLAQEIEEQVNESKVRLIFWYWNPVKAKYSPELVSNKWEKWTFDKDDSISFGMKYNGTYYFNNIRSGSLANKVDVFFIGLDKGRYADLKLLESNLRAHNLTTDFHIVSTQKQLVRQGKYKPRLSYAAVIEKINSCRAILEVMQEGQTGLTLRSMESIFFSKKLITSNLTIDKYNFYNKENIFILGVDDFERIKDFVEAPYKTLESKLISQYSFDNWILRLINNIELDDRVEENVSK